MTPLSDALTAAQRRALSALEKAYVAGQVEADDLHVALETCGITDHIDRAFLVASLDVLREWGVAAPTMSERVAREDASQQPASDKQRGLITDLCRRKEITLPDLAGVSKAQASELIDSLQNGSYDPEKWSVPF